MGNRTIARRYAAALVDLLAAEGQVDAGVAELTRAYQGLQSEGGELFRALVAPLFTLEERRRVLVAALEILQPAPLVANTLHLMLDKGRMNLLPEMVQECALLADAHSGRVVVRVETAEPMSPQLEVEVRVAMEGLTGKTVILDARVVPELLGGVVAHVGGKVYDSSLKTRLTDLKNQLIHARVVPVA